MDQLRELVQQIQDISGVILDALDQVEGGGGGEGAPPEGGAPEGGAPGGEAAPPEAAQ